MQKSTQIQKIAEIYLIDKPCVILPVEPIDITYFCVSFIENNLLMEFWCNEWHDVKMPLEDALRLIKTSKLAAKYEIELSDFDLLDIFDTRKSAQIDFVKAYLNTL